MSHQCAPVKIKLSEKDKHIFVLAFDGFMHLRLALELYFIEDNTKDECVERKRLLQNLGDACIYSFVSITHMLINPSQNKHTFCKFLMDDQRVKVVISKSRYNDISNFIEKLKSFRDTAIGHRDINFALHEKEFMKSIDFDIHETIFSRVIEEKMKANQKNPSSGLEKVEIPCTNIECCFKIMKSRVKSEIENLIR